MLTETEALAGDGARSMHDLANGASVNWERKNPFEIGHVALSLATVQHSQLAIAVTEYGR